MNSSISLSLRPYQVKSPFNSLSSYYFLSSFHYFLVDNNQRYFSKLIFLDKSVWARFFLLSWLQIPCYLFYVLDGIQFSSSLSNWVIQFNCNFMLTDDRSSFFTNINSNDFSIQSISSMFGSNS